MSTAVAIIADIEAIESVPLERRNLPDSTYEAIQQGANIKSDKIALQFFLQGTHFADAVFYTYRDLIGLINQTANMFCDLGIGKDDVVSMILPNLPQAYFTIFGGEAAGIVNPINPMLEPQVMADIMNAASTKVLVTMAPFPGTDIWQKVASIADQVPTLKTILRVDLASYLPILKKWGAKWLIFRGDKGHRPKAEVLDFASRARRYTTVKLDSQRKIQPDDIAAFFHTGGTTGTPKLAQHTHFSEVFDAWSAAETISLGADKILFCGLPLFHVNGVIVTGLIPWMKGASVVLGPPSGYRGEGVISNFWRIIDFYKINFFSGVPTVYSALLNVPLEGTDISSLEFAICGAAPMPVELFHQFEACSNIQILEGYGLTEGVCISSVNPPAGDKRVGSIGFRLPYQEMKVVELDSEGKYKRDCDRDEIGLIVVRGPNVFVGYKEEAHNRSAWIDSGDGKGRWLNSGDLGRQDAEGYFWLTGREKELIIRGGHNIDPLQIEDPLHRHPDVALVAAVGRLDANAGELPVAYVQLEPDAVTTEEELLDYARENIGERAAVPRAIHIIDELPMTTVGKIFKPQLIRLEIEDVYKIALQDIDGIASVNVQARADNLYGTIADISMTAEPQVDKSALEETARHTLGQYAVHYELTLS
jgi:fatty-acyl-CoA synthase